MSDTYTRTGYRRAFEANRKVILIYIYIDMYVCIYIFKYDIFLVHMVCDIFIYTYILYIYIFIYYIIYIYI